MLTIKSKLRSELGRDTNKLRASGLMPAVLYGPGIKNQNLELDVKEFDKLYRQAGGSSLISLSIEGQSGNFMVLVNDVDNDPVSGHTLHADLYQPDLTKEIEAKVPLVFEGESLAVKDLSGTLVKNISEITVKALPADLPREIKVNISKLKTFEDAILVKDLEVAANVKLLKDVDDIVALATPLEKIEEELEKPIEEKVEEVGKVEKEKKDEVSEEEAAPSGKK